MGSEDVVDDVNALLKLGVGDPYRLEHIKQAYILNSTIGTYVITANVKKLSDVTRIVSIQASCSGGGGVGSVSVNVPPTAVDDVVTLPEDKKFKIDVLANDSDSDGTLDNDTVTITSGPSDGTVKVKTDPANKGKIEYDPKNVPAGDYTFTYTVKDNDGAVSNTATVFETASTLRMLMTRQSQIMTPPPQMSIHPSIFR